MAKEKTRNVYRRLIVWMILFLLLAALAAAGYVYTKKQLADSEAKNAQEIERINAERVAQYNAAVAELSSQKVEVVNDQWPTPAAAGWDVIDLSTFPVGSGSQRNVTRKEMLTSGLLVINRWNAMPADLTDDMMISISNHSRADKDKENNIPTSNSSVMLQTVAVEALMELYKLYAAIILFAHKRICKSLGNKCLANARSSLQYDILFSSQKPDQLIKVFT